MDRSSIPKPEMAQRQLSLGMVVNIYALGKSRTVYYVATRGVVTPSVERKLSFTTPGSADK